MYTTDVGDRIRKWRRANGMTQAEFAARSGLSPNTVAQWETGGFVPRESTLARAAAALGVTVHELLG